jgi:hypothetical protein
VPSPDDIAAALDAIGDKPMDRTNAALMGLTWRKALQRGLVTEEELMSALHDYLTEPDAAA